MTAACARRWTPIGWSVCVSEVAGAWPWAGEAGRDALAEHPRALPDGSIVLVDGLVASTLPEVVAPACRRLRLVVLMHMPLGGRPTCAAAARGA